MVKNVTGLNNSRNNRGFLLYFVTIVHSCESVRQKEKEGEGEEKGEREGKSKS